MCVSAGIGSRTVVRQRQRTVMTTTWERRQGLCRSAYYVASRVPQCVLPRLCALDGHHYHWLHFRVSDKPRPLCRTLTEDYSETVYDLDIARVHEVLVQLIGEVWGVKALACSHASVQMDRCSVQPHDCSHDML